MLEPKNVIIDDELEFQLTPIPVMHALVLDKQIVSLLLPAMSGFAGLDTIDMSETVGELSGALQKMGDKEFQKFVIALTATTIFIPAGGAPVELNENKINEIFSGRLFSLYKLLLEIMRYNRFSPFELIGGGLGMKKISISDTPKIKTKTSGEK